MEEEENECKGEEEPADCASRCPPSQVLYFRTPCGLRVARLLRATKYTYMTSPVTIKALNSSIISPSRATGHTSTGCGAPAVLPILRRTCHSFVQEIKADCFIVIVTNRHSPSSRRPQPPAFRHQFDNRAAPGPCSLPSCSQLMLLCSETP